MSALIFSFEKVADFKISRDDTHVPVNYDQFISTMALLRRVLDDDDPMYMSVYTQLKSAWEKANSSRIPQELREPVRPGGVIGIRGPVGSGKTTFAYGIVNGWVQESLPDRILYRCASKDIILYSQLPNSSELIDEENVTPFYRSIGGTTNNYNIIINDEHYEYYKKSYIDTLVHKAWRHKTIIIFIGRIQSEIWNNCKYRIVMI